MTDTYQWLRQCEGFLIDLDGTMYRGNEAIPHAKEFIEWLEQTGKKYLYVTNNSAPLPSKVADKLRRMGIPAETEHILTSSQVTAMYIKDHAKDKTPTFFAIGEEGLYAALEEAGCNYEETNPDYVVIGIDRDLTYEKLKIASLAIQKGAVFLGTNADKRVPTDQGLLPGAGSISAMLAAASGTEPIWVGKPEARMVAYGMKEIGTVPERTVMIGDNLDTDIMAGVNAGVRTALILTGYSKRKDTESSQAKPDAIIEDLAEFMHIFAGNN